MQTDSYSDSRCDRPAKGLFRLDCLDRDAPAREQTHLSVLSNAMVICPEF